MIGQASIRVLLSQLKAVPGAEQSILLDGLQALEHA